MAKEKTENLVIGAVTPSTAPQPAPPPVSRQEQANAGSRQSLETAKAVALAPLAIGARAAQVATFPVKAAAAGLGYAAGKVENAVRGRGWGVQDIGFEPGDSQRAADLKAAGEKNVAGAKARDTAARRTSIEAAAGKRTTPDQTVIPTAAPAAAPAPNVGGKVWPAPAGTNPVDQGPDTAGAKAFLARNPVGSVRLTLPGESEARTFKDTSEAAAALGATERPQMPTTPPGAIVVNTPRGNVAFPNLAAGASRSEPVRGGGIWGPSQPTYGSVMPRNASPNNVFSMINDQLFTGPVERQAMPQTPGSQMTGGGPEALTGTGGIGVAAERYGANQFNNPDAAVSGRLGSVAQNVIAMMQNQGDFLRSRTIEESGTEGGPGMIRTPSGRLIERGNRFSRKESYGDLGDTTARLFESAMQAYASGDTERGKMFTDLATNARENVSQAGQTTRTGMTNKAGTEQELIRERSATGVADVNAEKVRTAAEYGYDRGVDTEMMKTAREYVADARTANPDITDEQADAILQRTLDTLSAMRAGRIGAGQNRPGMPVSTQPTGGVQHVGNSVDETGKRTGGDVIKTSSGKTYRKKEQQQ